MARDLDELEDDNPIPEDFEQSGDYCYRCGEEAIIGMTLCEECNTESVDCEWCGNNNWNGNPYCSDKCKREAEQEGDNSGFEFKEQQEF